MSDQGWRRGDEAAWWDAEHRRWRRGRLTARHTVPSYVYDVAVDDGEGTVSIAERLLRGVHDPAVVLDGENRPAEAPSTRSGPPPRRPGSSLAERSRASVNPGSAGSQTA